VLTNRSILLRSSRRRSRWCRRAATVRLGLWPAVTSGVTSASPRASRRSSRIRCSRSRRSWSW